MYGIGMESETQTERPVIDVDVPTPKPVKSKPDNPSLYLHYKKLHSDDGDWGFKVEQLLYPKRLGMPTDPCFHFNLNQWKIEELFKLDETIGCAEYKQHRERLLKRFVAIDRFIGTHQQFNHTGLGTGV
jgi:hypothetical protein